MSERILVADDEEILRENLCACLRDAGHVVEGVADGESAYARLREGDFHLVIADIRMPRLDGFGLLKRIQDERPEILVLLMTAYSTVESAVDAFRYGAFDYLTKPVIFEDLLQKVRNLAAYGALRDEVRRLRRDVGARLGFEGLVGQSATLRSVFELVDKVAPTNATVLVTGESGSGKELVARAVHARSALRDCEFLAVNMAAVPGELVETALFGHERGAFTGADRRRTGILRGVHGGTVFLDEVGDLPLAAQAKLLRAIESHEVTPVGADRPVKAEFRLITATNKDLEVAVREGRFRADLYFRLNVFRLRLPPLRDRREDIPALVAHFCAVHCRAQHRRPLRPSDDAMRLLIAHEWPGNVRELSNVIERATILADGETLDPEHLPAEMRAGEPPTMGLRAAVEHFEASHIRTALALSRGNREQAAKLLEVDQATLYRRLARHGRSEA